MRIVDLGKGVNIQSEWHNVVEAAAVCHVSPTTFVRRADAAGLKYSVFGRQRLYHQEELNRLLRILEKR